LELGRGISPSQPQSEEGAAPFRAFHCEAGVQLISQVAGDGETQPEPARLSGAGAFDPIKAFENPLHLIGRYAGAGVAHREAAFLFLGEHRDGDMSTFRSMLDRILHQVAQDGVDVLRVCANRRNVFAYLHLEAYPLGSRRRDEATRRFIDQSRQIDLLVAHGKYAGLQLAEIELGYLAVAMAARWVGFVLPFLSRDPAEAIRAL